MLPLAVSAEVVGVIVVVVLGIPTLIATVFFGVKQIRSGSFGLKVEAFLAERCDSIRVKVINVGGAEGTVSGLEIVDSEGHRIELPGTGRNFEEFKLSAESSRQIDFNAPEGRDFQVKDAVIVRWGKHEERLNFTPVKGSFWAEDEPSEPAAPEQD